jgi:branched-chain amino acid transport system substrate-binding protein
MRALAASTLVAVLALVPPALHAAVPFEIDVLVPLTGSNAFSGKQESDSIRVIEGLVNKAGGIDGRPVKFVIQDDQSNPQIAVQLANGIIARKVAVILGPSLVGDCGAILPLVQNGPVLWCFSPGFHPPKDSYGFSSNSSTTDLIKDNVRYFHALGLNKIGLIVSSDASGQDGERSIDAAVNSPEMAGMTIVAREHFNISDVSVAAQIAHIKASGAQAMFAWTTGTPLGTVLRGIAEAGLDIPVATTNANAYSVQLKSYAGFMPKTLLFCGQFHQVPNQIPNGPVKRKIEQYYEAYKTIGVAPEGSNSLSWDSTFIVIDALRKYGPDATAQQIHDYIESLHGWIGINGEYDFRDGSQRGLGEKDGIMIRWDPVKNVFVGVSKPGGLPLG